jgi:hypothetical protein
MKIIEIQTDLRFGACKWDPPSHRRDALGVAHVWKEVCPTHPSAATNTGIIGPWKVAVQGDLILQGLTIL